MKSINFSVLCLLFLGSCLNSAHDLHYDYAIVIHGGAGVMSPGNFSTDQQDQYIQKLDQALELGLSILRENRSALDAVESVVSLMEDSPLFNAGKGAVFTHTAGIELDASIMNGADINAGAVAGVTIIRNPIKAARKVMENSEHVLLSGRGAEEFARLQGVELVAPDYFYTSRRYEDLIKALKNEGVSTDTLKPEKYGTVGCVALDRSGNIAAGTSTGGRTNKKYGRIGDTPIIGAGTWAKNSTCGVSATGHGEYFIRYAVAHEISALMEHKGLTVIEAAREVIHNQLKPANGEGGVVCLDSNGNYSMEFNTKGMFRAYGNSAGEKIIGIFEDLQKSKR